METETVKFYICSECNRKYSSQQEALDCEKRHKKEKAFEDIEVFELRQSHLDLLKETAISWDDCEYGAPCIDCKRPYGNSSVEDDIADIIKLPKKDNWDKKEEDWNEKATEQMRDLHKETEIALQIVLHCQTFTLGKYKLDKDGYQNWKKI